MASPDNTPNLQVLRMNHSDKLARAVESMFFDETLCDVTICCHGQSVKAHRVILAATSLYFKELFANTLPGQYPIVFVSSIPIADLNAILEYIYKGEVTVPQSQLESLVRSADTLGIIGLGQLSLDNQDYLKGAKGQAECSPALLDSARPGSSPVSSASALPRHSDKPPDSNSISHLHSGPSRRGRKRKCGPVSPAPRCKSEESEPRPNGTGPVSATPDHLPQPSALAAHTHHPGPNHKQLTPSAPPISSGAPSGQSANAETFASAASTNGYSGTQHSPSSDPGSTCSVKPNLGKITKSKLRSWSQQITQKNRLSKIGSTTPTGPLEHEPSLLRAEGDSHEPSDPASAPPASPPAGASLPSPLIKLEARPRGRPRKITIPQLNPIPVQKGAGVNGASGVSLNGSLRGPPDTPAGKDPPESSVTLLRPAECQPDTPPVAKRGRGRPPLHSKLPAKPDSPQADPSQPKALASPVQVAL